MTFLRPDDQLIVKNRKVKAEAAQRAQSSQLAEAMQSPKKLRSATESGEEHLSPAGGRGEVEVKE